MKTTKMAFLGAGGISIEMANTIAHMPHIDAYAVAARDADRAEAFRAKYGFQKAYGSYLDLVRDPEVELVYVATPHSHHYDHAMLALENGKHVLCEKAFTANFKEAEELIAFARQKKLLITEAMWPRYSPFAKTIREVVASGIIGVPTLLTANLGYLISGVPRITDPALAGGALLDLSVYPINFASLVFGERIKEVTTAAVMTDTGVDGINNLTLYYESGQMAVLTSTIYSQTDRKGIVYGDKGHIVVDNINNPIHMDVFGLDRTVVAEYDAPQQITGYEYEVDAAVSAITNGELECAEMPHRETLRIMELLDSIRGSLGIRYPFE